MTDITEGGKYYVPTIEEFHPGFEYEMYNGADMWSKFICKIDYDQDGNPIVKIPDAPETHRVKKLGYDDIVSLGWSPVPENIGTGMYETVFFYLRIANNTCNISHKSDIGTGVEATRFLGTIRNKSELKRLMNQLRITA